jgi:hypothetical protein
VQSGCGPPFLLGDCEDADTFSDLAAMGPQLLRLPKCGRQQIDCRVMLSLPMELPYARLREHAVHHEALSVSDRPAHLPRWRCQHTLCLC